MGKREFKDWDGTIEVGLFAAGDNDDLNYNTVDFSNIRMEAIDGKLSKPNTVLNTNFADGNIVSNWSFENIMPCLVQTGTGWTCNQHFEGSATENAYEGRFYCRIENKPAGATCITPKSHCYFEKGGDVATRLKITYRVRSFANIRIQPVLVSYPRDGSTSQRTPLIAKTIQAASGWTKYEDFVTMPDANINESFEIEIIDKEAAINTTIDIDNILVSPIFGSSNNPPLTTIIYADALEQKFQTVTVTDEIDVVSAVVLDQEGRVYRTLPFYATDGSDAEFHEVKSDPLAGVRAYYQSSTADRDWIYGELENDHERVIYENSPTGRVIKQEGRKSALDVGYEYSWDMSW